MEITGAERNETKKQITSERQYQNPFLWGGGEAKLTNSNKQLKGKKG